jgi:hypothetical protein
LAQPGYAHYSAARASRIDLISINGDLLQRKRGIETIAITFTDHLAVSLHLTIDMPLVRRGRGLWKMDTAMLAEHTITEEIDNMGSVPTPEMLLPKYYNVVGQVL